MKSLGRRLARVERKERVHEADRGPAFLIVMPDAWPDEDCLAYDTLQQSGDMADWVELVAKHSGQRPGPATRVIALRKRDDGPA